VGGEMETLASEKDFLGKFDDRTLKAHFNWFHFQAIPILFQCRIYEKHVYQLKFSDGSFLFN